MHAASASALLIYGIYDHHAGLYVSYSGLQCDTIDVMCSGGLAQVYVHESDVL